MITAATIAIVLCDQPPVSGDGVSATGEGIGEGDGWIVAVGVTLAIALFWA
jgi:hypothetical protein